MRESVSPFFQPLYLQNEWRHFNEIYYSILDHLTRRHFQSHTVKSEGQAATAIELF